MAYNMSYSTLPAMTSSSIGGIIPGAYSIDADLLTSVNPNTNQPYVNITLSTNDVFTVSLSPGAYIFTSSVFASGPTEFILQSGLNMNETNLVGSTTNVNAITTLGPDQGGSASSCFAFNVVTNPSTILFQINFPASVYPTSVFGSWSLMRIG